MCVMLMGAKLVTSEMAPLSLCVCVSFFFNVLIAKPYYRELYGVGFTFVSEQPLSRNNITCLNSSFRTA